MIIHEEKCFVNFIDLKVLLRVCLLSQENIAVGPSSVGYRLLREGLIFGGNTLTATDIAVAAGLAKIEGDKTKVDQIPKSTVNSAVDKMHRLVEEVIDQIKVCNNIRSGAITGKLNI